jgi:hypothetical protein
VNTPPAVCHISDDGAWKISETSEPYSAPTRVMTGEDLIEFMIKKSINFTALTADYS